MNYKFYSLLVFSLIFSNCLDEINLETPDTPEDLIVIQGKLTKGNPSIINVNVNQIFDFTGFNQPKNISDATVQLLDEAGNSLELNRLLNGTYRLEIPENDPTVSIAIGQSYQLMVRLANGNTYESDLEAILDVPEMTNIEYEFSIKSVVDFENNVVTRPILDYFVSTPLSLNTTEKSRIKWEYEGAFRYTDTPGDTTTPKQCYLIEQLNFDDVVLFNGIESSLNTLERFPVFEVTAGFKYAEGYYFSLFQESLTETAFNYFSNVQDAIERNGTIFEEPAGKIRSNFRNIDDANEEVFGYFYAVSRDTIGIYVPPSDAGNPSNWCPLPPIPFAPPNQCDDCLLQLNATLLPPSYWEE